MTTKDDFLNGRKESKKQTAAQQFQLDLGQLFSLTGLVLRDHVDPKFLLSKQTVENAEVIPLAKAPSVLRDDDLRIKPLLKTLEPETPVILIEVNVSQRKRRVLYLPFADVTDDIHVILEEMGWRPPGGEEIPVGQGPLGDVPRNGRNRLNDEFGLLGMIIGDEPGMFGERPHGSIFPMLDDWADSILGVTAGMEMTGGDPYWDTQNRVKEKSDGHKTRRDAYKRIQDAYIDISFTYSNDQNDEINQSLFASDAARKEADNQDKKVVQGYVVSMLLGKKGSYDLAERWLNGEFESKEGEDKGTVDKESETAFRDAVVKVVGEDGADQVFEQAKQANENKKEEEKEPTEPDEPTDSDFDNGTEEYPDIGDLGYPRVTDPEARKALEEYFSWILNYGDLVTDPPQDGVGGRSDGSIPARIWDILRRAPSDDGGEDPRNPFQTPSISDEERIRLIESMRAKLGIATGFYDPRVTDPPKEIAVAIALSAATASQVGNGASMNWFTSSLALGEISVGDSLLESKANPSIAAST
ncbi:MAG: hypothetical protein AAF558_03795 [Verrucomicrobiota bacterium]